MRLPDTKTGTRIVPLTPAVARLFDGLSCTPGNPWVFPGKKKGTRLSESARGSKASASMTFVTRSPPAPSRSTRSCR